MTNSDVKDDWDFQALPEDVLETMKFFGDFGPTVTPKNREIKGYMEGGKCYFDSKGLREIARHFTIVADWLDRRADSND